MNEKKWVHCIKCGLSFPSLSKKGLCGLCNYSKPSKPKITNIYTLNKWLKEK